MNHIDAEVVKVVGGVYYQYGKWWINVIATSWGRESEHTIMLDTQAEAEAVKPGYKFLM